MTSTEPLEPESTSGSTGSPGGSKSKAWLLVLGGLIVVLAVVLVVVLITRDDDSDSAATTTTTEPPTTTTEPPPPRRPHHHGGAADHRRAASHHAPPPADHRRPAVVRRVPLRRVAERGPDRGGQRRRAPKRSTQIFAQPYSAASQWMFQTCDPAAGSLYCTWNGVNNAPAPHDRPHPHRWSPRQSA